MIVWKTNWGKQSSQRSDIKEEKNPEAEEADTDVIKTKVLEKNKNNQFNVKTIFSLFFFKKKHLKKGKDKFKADSASNASTEDSMFEVEVEKGDEFMAVKPWLGAIKEPSGWKGGKGQNQKPKVTLDLEYVFGYRAK